MPERYGPWTTVYDRFRHWRDDGTFDAILERLQLDHALGRSRGGLTTRIHLVRDRHGWPLTVSLSPVQDAESRHFTSTLESVYLPGFRGRPRKRCRYVVADKGYNSEALRRYGDTL